MIQHDNIACLHGDGGRHCWTKWQSGYIIMPVDRQLFWKFPKCMNHFKSRWLRAAWLLGYRQQYRRMAKYVLGRGWIEHGPDGCYKWEAAHNPKSRQVSNHEISIDVKHNYIKLAEHVHRHTNCLSTRYSSSKTNIGPITKG